MRVFVEEGVDHFQDDALLRTRQTLDPLQPPKQPSIAWPELDPTGAQQFVCGNLEGLHQGHEQRPVDAYLPLLALRQYGLIHPDLGGQLDLRHVSAEAHLSDAPADSQLNRLNFLPSLRHVGSI